MSLLDYQEAVPWANAIKVSLLERRMPPFLPEDDGGPFRDTRGLSAQELDTLVDWAVGAAPEGEPPDGVDGVDPPTTAARPEPDLLLRGADVVVEESVSEKTVCLTLETGLSSPRRVSAIEVFPGSPALLRRATIFAGASCSEGAPLASWLPDRGRVSFPDGTGSELGASSTVAVELVYVKGWGQEGRRLTDRTAFALSFAEDAAKVRSVSIGRSFALEAPFRLVALYPSKGDDAPLRVEAVGRDGSVRLLLHIERFDPAWREKYFFQEPVLLEKGTSLRSSHEGVWADLAGPR